MTLMFSKKPKVKAGWLRPRKAELDLCQETYFLHELMQEKKRAQRSNRPLVVMLVDTNGLGDAATAAELAVELCESVKASVRDTDICGFLESQKQIAVILTGIEPDRVETARRVVPEKIRENFASLAGEELAAQVKVTFHVIDPGATDNQLSELYHQPGGALEEAAGQASHTLQFQSAVIDEEEVGLRRLARFLQECSKARLRADM